MIPVRARPARERGAVLLLMLAIVVLGAASWLYSTLGTEANRTASEREHNAKVLREAKDAVLGWVARNAADTTDVNPGKLPCPEALGNFQMPPDLTNEGVTQGFCGGSAAAVGRLPWRSLGIDKPYDATGEVLWFVVSPGWKRPNNATPEPPLGLNSNSQGQLVVDGAANAAVAAIIAPGRPLQLSPTPSQVAQGCVARFQARLTFPPSDALDYVDCLNVAGASVRTSVVDNVANVVSNDQVVVITAAEVMAAIEGVVAKRIEQTVVPQLQTVYAGAIWGTSAANPVLPFAAPFADPALSPFEGQVDLGEGLLPLTASTCNPPITNGRCNPGFVRWKTSPITLTRSGGDANFWSYSCASSSSAEIVCDVTYGKALCISGILGPCTVSGGNLTVAATAQNVAMALRRHASPLPVTGISAATMTSPLIAAGADRGGAAVSVQGTLPTVSGCTMNVNLFGLYFCTGLLGVTTTETVRIPVGVFADHALVKPATGDPAYWFVANRWHDVSYYAVSDAHLATGSRDCVASANCLTLNVQDGTPLGDRRALLALAGRSLNGTSGSNRALADFLDTTENIDGNAIFEQNRINGIFNDRFVSLSP